MQYIKANDGAVPPRVGVFALQTGTFSGFAQLQRNFWPSPSDQPQEKQPPKGSYKMAMHFRHLMLLVAHWAKEDADFLLSTGIHVPLWPVKQVYLSHYIPIDPAILTNAEKQLDMFCRDLGVVDMAPLISDRTAG
jgi:hypothetical protein